MRATLIYGAGDVRIGEVPDPQLQAPTDALVRVLRACICGSDLWPYGSKPAVEHGDRIGHEFLGVIEETGSEVSGFKRGDVVVAPFVWSDGTCDFCREGLQTSCRHGGYWAANGIDGGQGEAARVPQAHRGRERAHHGDGGRRRRGGPVRSALGQAPRRRADHPDGPAQGPHRPRPRIRRH